MAGSQFDDLFQSLTGSRRSLLGGALTLAAGWHGLTVAGARKQKKQRNPKPAEPNAYGCLDIGAACHGNNSRCCSGICAGAKPKQGKKDRSRCVAHDSAICEVEFDICSFGRTVRCGATNPNCICTLTTGNAPFCGDFTRSPRERLCRDCRRDTDCADEFGPGAACVVFTGLCEADCPATGGTACVPACADQQMERLGGPSLRAAF